MNTVLMIVELLGGLGLFIFGMKMMGEGLEKAAGDKMKNLLEALTKNRFMGVVVGTAVTAIIQSSSATTVMVIGFVNAGLMNLVQTTGIIMGANIGTTITAQLIAFKLTKIAPVAVFLGIILIFFAKKRSLKKFGEILAGFGILFMGLSLMSEAMYPLRESESFANFMIRFENPLFGVLAGCLVTVLVQSSSASIGLLQALAMQQLIGLEGAIFILFGQNIGTCVTAVLASIGANATAKRAAGFHLLFNIVGTSLFMLLIWVGVPFVPFVKSLSGADTVRQIANAHTVFNVATTIILFPLAGQMVKLVEWILPAKPEDISDKKLKYLDMLILETPPIAVGQILKEIDRMSVLARDNVEKSIQAFIHKDEALIAEVFKREDTINFLNREITRYLVKVNGLDLPNHDLTLVGGLFHVVNDIERIGDHAENLAEYAEYSIDNRLNYSEIAMEEVSEMKDRVLSMLDDALEAFNTRDKTLVQKIEPQEQHIDEMKAQLRTKHIQRLNCDQCSPGSGVIYLDVISNLERIADHATNIAYSVLDTK